MSSQYHVLNNKPIDQWKVTELKDELRRRKITLRGLKEELVRRLFDAIRNEEMTKNEEVADEDQSDHPASHPPPGGVQVSTENSADHNNVVIDTIGQTDTVATITGTDANHADVIPDPVGKADCDATITSIDSNQEIKVQDAITSTSGMDIAVSGTITNVVSLEHTANESYTITTECETNVLITRSEEKGGEAVHEEKGEEAVHEEKGEEAVHEEKGEEAVHEEKGEESMQEDSDVPREEIKLSLPESDNQVSVDSPDLGSQVKCESITIDSVSIIEKNKLKDNLNADDFHLEQEVVKQEMVQPSSSTVPSIGGDLQTPDDAKEEVKHLVSLGDNDAQKRTNFDLSKKEDHLDEGSPEKLNLDRTSSDELMEEDVLESKQVESNIKSEELARNTEVKQEPSTEEKTKIDGELSGSTSDKKCTFDEGQWKPTLTIEKRKLEDQEAAVSNEAPKRQRRWNSGTVKVPERQLSNLSTATTPKSTYLPTPRRVFAKSEPKSTGDSPKERIVPPSQKPATTSLRIDKFLRPFTLKAVQELLAKTGTVCSFWMDHIKTHCYVTYSSADEANATRNALYNLQWPPNGGNLLVAEFVDPQEVKARIEAPPQSPALISPNPNTPRTPNFQQPQAGQPPPRQHPLRQQPPLHPVPPTQSDLPAVRERLPPPPPPREPEPPALTLDDLFKKTKVNPRIYYLPLSDEEVASKLAAQGKSH